MTPLTSKPTVKGRVRGATATVTVANRTAGTARITMTPSPQSAAAAEFATPSHAAAAPSYKQLSLLARLARDRGLARAIDNAESTYRESLWRAIEELAATGREFCSDDVRELAGDPPAGFSPNVAGAIVHAAATKGLIHQVGYTRSCRVIGHGNLVRTWRGGETERTWQTDLLEDRVS